MLLARPLASELPPQVEAGWPSREDGAVTALRALIFASIDFFEIVDRAGSTVPRWLVAVAALPVDGYTIAAEAERQAILAQVRDCDGNLTQAARRLGIARSTCGSRNTVAGLP